MDKCKYEMYECNKFCILNKTKCLGHYYKNDNRFCFIKKDEIYYLCFDENCHKRVLNNGEYCIEHVIKCKENNCEKRYEIENNGYCIKCNNKEREKKRKKKIEKRKKRRMNPKRKYEKEINNYWKMTYIERKKIRKEYYLKGQ